MLIFGVISRSDFGGDREIFGGSRAGGALPAAGLRGATEGSGARSRAEAGWRLHPLAAEGRLVVVLLHALSCACGRLPLAV